MYRVLIVDDEPLVRRGIRRCVNWNELGIETVAEAANGTEALAQFVQDKPDIVLLDVNMPRMDGLEFASIVRRKRPDCRIVMLTGYSDFEYLRRALRIGVADYVLKPVTSQVITDIMREQVEDLDKERDGGARAPMPESPRHAEVLNALLRHEPKATAEAAEMAMKCGLADDPQVRFAIVKEYLTGCDMWEDDLSQFAILNVSQETLDREQAGWAFATHKNEMALVITAGEKSAEVLEKIHESVTDLLEIPIDVGMSSTGPLSSLAALADEARLALDCAFVLSDAPFISYEEVCRRKEALLPGYPLEKETALLDNLFSAPMDVSLARIDDLFESLANSTLDMRQSKRHIMRLLLTLDNTVRSISSWTQCHDDGEEGDFDPISLADEFSSLKEAHEWVRQYYVRTYHYVHGVRSRSAQLFVKIRSYIEKNYMDSDLNLKKCSEELYLSPGYIGSILKKESGRTFVDLLNEYRIEQARRLLKTPDSKVRDVSEKVGFTHPTYFSSVFKKMTGMSPSQFKDVPAGSAKSR